MYYLEDLFVGQRFASRAYRFDAQAIIDFANQFDPQPFHTDPEAAKETFFQGLAASGWHTAAMSARLVLEALPIAGGMVGGGGSLNWLRPVRPDDEIRVEGSVVEIRPSRSRPDRGIVTINVDTVNQTGEVVQNMQANVFVFRRAEG
jgi:acyl dehydratase